MIRGYTNIEQSLKLAEILPLESADMCYIQDLLAGCKYGEYKPYIGNLFPAYGQDKIRCWSLAALLYVLPEYNLQRTDWGNKTEYKIVVTVNDNNYASKNYDNPLDACVELILKLHELKML